MCEYFMYSEPCQGSVCITLLDEWVLFIHVIFALCQRSGGEVILTERIKPIGIVILRERLFPLSAHNFVKLLIQNLEFNCVPLRLS